mgnify:CR=1 FL=1
MKLVQVKIRSENKCRNRWRNNKCSNNSNSNHRNQFYKNNNHNNKHQKALKCKCTHKLISFLRGPTATISNAGLTSFNIQSLSFISREFSVTSSRTRAFPWNKTTSCLSTICNSRPTCKEIATNKIIIRTMPVHQITCGSE